MTTDPRPVGSISEETARLLDALGWVLDGARPARTNTEPSAQSAEAEPAKAAKAGSAEPREAAEGESAETGEAAESGSVETGEAAAEAQSAKSAKAGSAEHGEAAEPSGAGEAAAEAAEAGSHPSACSWCPVCRGVASLRSVNPDAVDRLADAATVLAQALSDLAVQVREDAPPGGRSTPGKAPGGRRTPGKAAGAAAYTIGDRRR